MQSGVVLENKFLKNSLLVYYTVGLCMSSQNAFRINTTFALNKGSKRDLIAHHVIFGHVVCKDRNR